MEVRRCSACGAAAAVAVARRTTEHEMSVAGLPARGTTRRETFRCQDCGARFVLRPRNETVTQIVIEAVLLAAVTAMEIGVLSLGDRDATLLAVTAAVFAPFQITFGVLLWVAVRRTRVRSRHPVILDAPVPAIRFPELDPHAAPRRCAHCGEAAALVETRRHRVQGIPTGTVWHYRCTGGHDLALRSAWRAMMPELVLVAVLASTLVPAFVPALRGRWSMLGGGLLAVAIGSSLYRARQAWLRNPPAVAPARIVTSR